MSNFKKGRKNRVQGGWAATAEDEETRKAPSSNKPTQADSPTGEPMVYTPPTEPVKRSVIPWNFTWIVEGLLCAMAFPTTQEELQFLIDSGVKYVVSCTEKRPPILNGCSELTSIFLKVPNLGIPTCEQAQEFIKIVLKAYRERTAVCVHCLYGQGRTGTMLACYLISCHNFTAVNAIHKVRELRPWSIEMRIQEQFILDYERAIRAALQQAREEHGNSDDHEAKSSKVKSSKDNSNSESSKVKRSEDDGCYPGTSETNSAESND